MAVATYLFLTRYLAQAPCLTWSCLVLVYAVVTALGATTTAAEAEINMKSGEQDVTRQVLF